MRTSASRQAAWAWSSWARPSSPPPGVTPELRDMFWALKGQTSKPSSRKMRQKAAASMDLPALEQVPWSMRAGVGRLRLAAGAWSGVASRSASASASLAWSSGSRTAMRNHRPPSRPG